MPKLLVLVEKDKTGKLWNYIFNRKNEATVVTYLAAPHWLIHKSESFGTVPQQIQISPHKTECIKIGVIHPGKKYRLLTAYPEKQQGK
jgi:hypothetical protein